MKINLQEENRSVTKFRSEQTHNGHEEHIESLGIKVQTNLLPIVKSAFQKYIRRGNFEKALYYVL